jgi:hypothetical protein
MRVSICTASGAMFGMLCRIELDAVPRVGETVLLGDRAVVVRRVDWLVDERFGQHDVRVVVSDPPIATFERATPKSPEANR